MTKIVELDIAQTNLCEIIAELRSGDEVVIVRNEKPVARLSPLVPALMSRQPGLLKDAITLLSDDDDHLEDFREYMG
jgi:antitoxin (DNA-binding transcriptional repressor) of toxin-antitoxin stability system